jgi:hypothetical protein
MCAQDPCEPETSQNKQEVNGECRWLSKLKWRKTKNKKGHPSRIVVLYISGKNKSKDGDHRCARPASKSLGVVPTTSGTP